MTRKTWILLAVVIIAGVAIATGVSLLHDGLSARAKPTGLETMLARYALQLAVPANAKALHNPVAETEENLKDGRVHFADHCATCHANDGSGDTMLGRGMYPKPPDLRLPETQRRTDGELFWIIENGVRFTGMPGFGGGHGSEEDSWKLVLFLRRLPQLSPEEKLGMEHYNPKGPEERDEEKEEDDFLRGGAVQQKAAPEHHH